ncbi:UNVERIFIED_CONTAM: hypothetical protein HDU68_008239 [Siphonaria sp. JEL0065]|nr:hypothetical protein HDU68_008239 [Siphonaria sp. JEL0065]
MDPSSIELERSEFIKAFISKSVEAANALYDQYRQTTVTNTVSTAAVSLGHGLREQTTGSETLASLISNTPSGTSAGTPLLPPATAPAQAPFIPSPPATFALPLPHDRSSSSIGLGLFASPQMSFSNAALMNYNEAEAILTSPLCSPLLGPSGSSPYLHRRLSSFMPRRPSVGGVRKLSNASIYFPQPESRSSSLSSSFGLDRYHDPYSYYKQQQNVFHHQQHFIQPHPLAFTPLTPSIMNISPESSPIKSEISLPPLMTSPEFSFIPLQESSLSSSSSSTASSALFSNADGKKRTRLTPAQRQYMMNIFEQDNNPPSQVIRQVAETVGMNFRLVQYW